MSPILDVDHAAVLGDDIESIWACFLCDELFLTGMLRDDWERVLLYRERCIKVRQVVGTDFEQVTNVRSGHWIVRGLRMQKRRPVDHQKSEVEGNITYCSGNDSI